MKHNKKNDLRKKSVFITLGILSLFVVGGLLFSLAGTDMNQSSSGSTAQAQQKGTDQTQNTVVARVNGQDIYRSEVSQIRRDMSSQGQEVSQEVALDQAVATTVLVQEVESKGYLLSVEETEEKLSEQLSLQGADLDTFKTQTQDAGQSYEDALESYQFQFGVETYFEDVLSNQTPEVSESEIEEYYQVYLEQTQSQDQEVLELNEIEDQIVQQIQTQKLSQMRNEYLEELVDNADVEYM